MDMRVQVEVSEKRMVEKEIQLPYYTKNGCHYYRVSGKNDIHKITLLDGHCGYEQTFLSSAMKAEECTEQDWMDAYNQVFHILFTRP